MNETFNPSQKFLEFWADVAAKVAAAGAAGNGSTPPTQAARDASWPRPSSTRCRNMPII